MKNETEIRCFEKVMKNLGYKDIQVKPADPKDYGCEGAYLVGFNYPHGFAMDLDIVPAEITVTVPRHVRNLMTSDPKMTFARKPKAMRLLDEIKARGYVVTGYKPTRGTRDEPPDVEDFTIGEYQDLCQAFTAIVLFYVKEQIQNVWEGAYYDEIAEAEEPPL